MVGGQDELVFDGGSLLVDAAGEVHLARAFVRGVALRRRVRPATAASSSPSPTGRRRRRRRDASACTARSCSARATTEQERLRGHGARALRRRGLGAHARDRGRRARRGPRHAVMMPSRYTAEMSKRRRGGAGAAPRRAVRHAADRAAVRDHARRAARRVRGPAARHHRGEHSGTLPRAAADGDLEQARRDAAHHGQQERDGRRLRDALRRHGRRLRAAQGLHEDAGVSSSRATATRSRPRSPSA